MHHTHQDFVTIFIYIKKAIQNYRHRGIVQWYFLLNVITTKFHIKVCYTIIGHKKYDYKNFFSIPDLTNSLVLKSISHIFDDYMSIFNLLYNKKEMANNKIFQHVLSKPNVSQCKQRLHFVVSLCFHWFRTFPFMANIYICHINRTHMPINDTIMLGIILSKHLLQQYSYDNKQKTKYQGYALPLIISFSWWNENYSL